MGAFMGIYGRDCGPVLTGYHQSVNQLIASSLDPLSGCPCFDEEVALSLTYFNNPKLVNTGTNQSQTLFYRSYNKTVTEIVVGKIISPGLPKTGTTTLADSLHLLGFNMLHGEGNFVYNTWCDGITNGLEHQYEKLYKDFPIATWIVTYSRNVSLWVKSLSKHLVNCASRTGCKAIKRIFSEPRISSTLADRGLTVPHHSGVQRCRRTEHALRATAIG